MTKLRGKIIAETDKAILFQIIEDECFHLQGQTEWFPKSHIKINKKTVDGKKIIYVQEWLYNSKIKIKECER